VGVRECRRESEECESESESVKWRKQSEGGDAVEATYSLLTINWVAREVC
jgi:hypothetical protein